MDFEFNEIDDSRAKSARKLDQTLTSTSPVDASSYVKSKFIRTSEFELHKIAQLNTDRKTATNITRLRMEHHKHIKISTHQNPPKMQELH